MARFEHLKNEISVNPTVWLITGVAGFIGSNILETLLTLNQKVVGVDNFSTGYQGNLDEVRSAVSSLQWDNFCLIKGDIHDPNVCQQAMTWWRSFRTDEPKSIIKSEKVEYVLHQAALGSVSRSIEDILNEVSILADKGTREIHLLGQNVNNFKGTLNGEKSTLSKLIELTAKIENIDRIRFTTSHPHEFKDDLVEVYDRVPELVSHVHLPVQSGSDRILKLMRRRYNVEKYLNLVDKIRVVRPDMSFSSDFIVGFPGETNEDFQDTMNIINEVRYDESFSFIYSPRPNTTASDMEDDVTNEEKKERLKILQTRLSQLSFGFSRKKVGTNQDCLIYGQSKRDPGQLQGRTICNRVVNFQSNDTDLVGQIVNIQINEALPNCLRGNLQN